MHYNEYNNLFVSKLKLIYGLYKRGQTTSITIQMNEWARFSLEEEQHTSTYTHWHCNDVQIQFLFLNMIWHLEYNNWLIFVIDRDLALFSNQYIYSYKVAKVKTVSREVTLADNNAIKDSLVLFRKLVAISQLIMAGKLLSKIPIERKSWCVNVLNDGEWWRMRMIAWTVFTFNSHTDFLGVCDEHCWMG